MATDFGKELIWRGLIQQISDPSLAEKMAAETFTLYSGFDPSSESLHVGNMVPLLALARAQRSGHRPIAVVGGATGMIGDPSGKSDERNLLSADDVLKNVAGIKPQLERFLDFSPSAPGGGALLVNNGDWFAKLGYLEFLRDVGKHFGVGMMMAKESVRARLEDRAQGISYTEFSYMLVQAYDFMWLGDHHQCRLQIGGSNEWGNITAGIELTRKLRQREVFGLTLPLLLTSSGSKFGKTEKGAVWLSPDRTTPHDFYQFFVRAEDKEVGRLLRFFTFLEERVVVELEARVAAAPEKREAQQMLAREVTTLVHGSDEAARAASAATTIFSGGLEATAARASELPHTDVTRSDIDAGLPLVDWLQKTAMCTSKSDARRQVEQGGVYVNDEQVRDVARVLRDADLLAPERRVIVLRKGKKLTHLLRLV